MVLGGKSNEEKAREERERQREHQLHSQNLQGGQEYGESTAEILHELSSIDDLPINKDDPVMGQLVSKITSTSNLSPEQVKSDEWVMEYLLILYLCKFPKEDGCHGDWRAYAHGDITEYREPLDAEDRMMIEAYIGSAQRALTRSEDFAAVEESTRTINESVVRDESQDNSSSGGILGRMGLK
jgi:hypothetical protein